MLEHSHVCSSGGLVLEKRNSQKLSEDQKRLIENNLFEIKRIIGSALWRKKSRLKNKNIKELLSNAVSYIPEECLLYDKIKAKQKSFSQVIATRCLLRLIDEYRKEDKYEKLNRDNQNLISDIELDLANKNKDITYKNVCEELVKNGKKPYIVFNNIKKFDIKNVKSGYTINPTKDLETEEFFSEVLKKSRLFFKEYDDTALAKQNKIAKAFKIIIKDYLVPKYSGQEYKSLDQISKEVNFSKARIVQMIKSNRMKRFIKTIL